MSTPVFCHINTTRLWQRLIRPARVRIFALLIEAIGADLSKQVDTREKEQHKNKDYDQSRQTNVPTGLFAQKVEAHGKRNHENQQEAKKGDNQSLSIHFGTGFGDDFQEREDCNAPKREICKPFPYFGTS